MSNSSDQFDASASMLGYLYQIRYALLIALNKLHEIDDPDDGIISLEKLDDVAFEEGGVPKGLLQTKLHEDLGNITNRGSDLWKTIRVWATAVSSGVVDVDAAVFTLVTTQAAAPSSIALYLSQDKEKRNPELALKLLREIALEESSESNKAAYKIFNDLAPDLQKRLVESIYIVGSADGIVDVRKGLEKKLRLSVDQKYLKVFVDRVEAYWFSKVVDVLRSGEGKDINLGELIVFLNDLSGQFLPYNLPADYAAIEPLDLGSYHEMRNFIRQLRLIEAGDGLVSLAIKDYYRAVEQRNRWSRDGLLRLGELGEYDRKIEEEWLRIKSLHEWDADLSSHDGKVVFGRRIFADCQAEKIPRIRSGFTEPFLSRGSVHRLADVLSIGWHPDYVGLADDKGEAGAA